MTDEVLLQFITGMVCTDRDPRAGRDFATLRHLLRIIATQNSAKTGLALPAQTFGQLFDPKQGEPQTSVPVEMRLVPVLQDSVIIDRTRGT